jgi:cell shape-determining protein MreC
VNSYHAIVLSLVVFLSNNDECKQQNEAYNKKDEQVMQLADQLSKYSKALSLCEIERFQTKRSEVYHSLLGTIVSANIYVRS